MNYRRVLAVLSILAAVLWLLLRPSGRETFASEKAASSSSSRTASNDTEIKNPKRHSEATGSKAPDQHLSRHDANQLKDFILPHLEGKDISLHEALHLLDEAYRETCFLSQEKPLGLKFSVKDEPENLITFSLHGRSFLTCLDHLAALAGLTVDRDGTNFTLLRSATAEKPANAFIRFGPAAKDELRALTGSLSGEIKDEWESLLRAAGLVLEPGTKVVSTDQGFQISGTEAEIARVRSGIKIANKEAVQIRITSSHISLTSPLDQSAAVLTDTELQALLHQLNEQRDAHVEALPSITTKFGQLATMEIIRETTKNGQPDWTGIKDTYVAERTGLKVTTSDRSERRPADASEPRWLVEADSVNYSGNTRLQLIRADKGVYHYRLVTMTTVDAAGRPLSNAPSGPVAE